MHCALRTFLERRVGARAPAGPSVALSVTPTSTPSRSCSSTMIQSCRLSWRLRASILMRIGGSPHTGGDGSLRRCWEALPRHGHARSSHASVDIRTWGETALTHSLHLIVFYHSVLVQFSQPHILSRTGLEGGGGGGRPGPLTLRDVDV
jgi:hypothetical protein